MARKISPKKWRQTCRNGGKFVDPPHTHLHSVILHVVLVHGHEDDVDKDTQRDEQLCEGVKYSKGHDLQTWID